MNAARPKTTSRTEGQFLSALDEETRRAFNRARPKAKKLTREDWAALPETRRAELRMLHLKARGQAPDSTGGVVANAPARGAFEVVTPQALYPKGEGEFEAKPAGYLGRDRVQIVDAFRVMELQCQRAKAEFLLSPGQVAMGRMYRSLHEAYHGGASPRDSLDFMPGGSGAGLSWIDSRVEMSRRIDLLHRRIGAGLAQRVRRIRPARRGSRVSITDRRLADMVCLEDKTISDVLAAHGWAKHGEIVRLTTLALADILDRMMGPVRGGGAKAVHYGEGPGTVWGEGR